MSSIAVGEHASNSGSKNSGRPLRLSPVWALAIIFLVNSLVIPITAIVASTQHNDNLVDLLNYIWPATVGVFHAQVVLLSIWMTFGRSPRRWRHLLVSFLVAAGGTIINALLTLNGIFQEEFSLPWDQWMQLLLEISQLPLLDLTVVWLFHALLAIPQWFFGITIDFPRRSAGDANPQRQFGVLQLLLWTSFFAIPLALAKLLVEVNVAFETSFELIQAGLPLLTVLVACLPFSLAVFLPRLMSISFFASLSWMAAIFLVDGFLPEGLQRVLGHPYLLTFSYLAVAANLLFLRYCGVRWLPISIAAQPDAASSQAEVTLSSIWA